MESTSNTLTSEKPAKEKEAAGMSPSMKRRLTLGPILALSTLILLLMDLRFDHPWVFFLLLGTVSTMGLAELYLMAGKTGVEPWMKTGLLFGAGLLIYQFRAVEFLEPGHPLQQDAGPLMLTALAVFLLLLGIAKPEWNKGTANIPVTVWGAAYIPFLMSYYIKLHALCPALVYLILVASKATDIAAYFTGSYYGKRKLCPDVSPNKTVEGALGGWLGGFLVSLALALCLKLFWVQDLPFGVELSVGKVFILCLTIGILAQLGDLSESLLKRRYRVKDSGALLPAFGGVLDLIDSLLFTGFFAYWLLLI